MGREKLDEVFATVFKAEKHWHITSLVSPVRIHWLRFFVHWLQKGDRMIYRRAL